MRAVSFFSAVPLLEQTLVGPLTVYAGEISLWREDMMSSASLMALAAIIRSCKSHKASQSRRGSRYIPSAVMWGPMCAT